MAIGRVSYSPSSYENRDNQSVRHICIPFSTTGVLAVPTTMPSALRQVLAKQGFAVLDGAMGTELESRGFDICSRLWSAGILLDEVLVLLCRVIHGKK